MSAKTSDRGDSLVEVLVALAVLSVGIAGLLGALGAHAASTTVNRDQAQAQTALLSAAEYVKSLPFTTCLPTSSTAVPSGAVPALTGFTITYGSTRTLTGGACSDAGSSPTKVVLVTVRVAGQGFQGVELDVVKRR